MELKKTWLMWVVIVSIIGYLVYHHFSNSTKTGYVLIQDIYSQFDLKKEMQKKYESSHNARKKVLDSMALVIRSLGQKIDAEKGKDTSSIREFRIKRMEYYDRNHRLGQDDSAQLKQYDDEILTQLNQYIKDFAKENHYQYIFGNTNGSLLAGDESMNLTAQMTQYVNERYQGRK